MAGRLLARAGVAGALVLALLGSSTFGPGGPIRPALAQDGGAPSPAAAAPPQAPSAQVSATAVFPDLLIADVQNAVLPDSVPDGRQIRLGSVGSDLWHGPNDSPDEVWMVTDRGPRGQGNNGNDRQSFAIPEYTPMVLHGRLAGDSVQVLETIPIVGQSGQPVSGLPNLSGRDAKPYDVKARTQLPYNPSGLDPEGLIRMPNGDFWIAEEYGPSLVHLNSNGMVLKRFVPHGIGLDGADYPVTEALPAVFVKRADSEGFESLAVSPDGGTIYVAMQSPLSNPNQDTGDKSRNTRILVFDVGSEQVVAEYVYRFESVKTIDPSKKADPEDLKISAMALCGDGRLLVLERTGRAARLYLADGSEATSLTGTIWDDLAMRPTLEAVNDVTVNGIQPLAKTMVLDLTDLPHVPDKLEGLAILNPTTIVLANDNDFDIGKFDKDGNNDGGGDKSKLVTLTLSQPLP